MRTLALVLVLCLLWGCAAVPTATQPTEPPPAPIHPADCRAAAQQLSSRYGIQILVFQDAVKTTPWDYTLTPASGAKEIFDALRVVEEVLALFPDGFVPQLWRGWESLSLCLVKSIQGASASGSLEKAQGLQFEDGGHAFLVLALAAPEELRHTLLHELGHLMENQIWGNSDALDDWQTLNPPEFSYSLDVHAPVEDFAYLLTGEERCFVDGYAMSYPEEDRARILEYAMSPGCGELFTAPRMQRKLKRLSAGIREAFQLEDASTFLWEQYLSPAAHEEV